VRFVVAGITIERRIDTSFAVLRCSHETIERCAFQVIALVEAGEQPAARCQARLPAALL